jgi:hypothetical protein
MRNTWALMAGSVVLATIVGCKTQTDRPVVSRQDGKATVSESGDQANAKDKSLVRVVNAVPRKQAVDVASDQNQLFMAVDYKKVTPYKEVADNVVDFKLKQTGRDTVLSNNKETLLDGNRYTIVALPAEKGGVTMRILRDEVTPDSGKARIRVINAAAPLKNVDVALKGQKEPVFDDVKYAAEAGYKDVTPTTATIEIRTDTPNRKPIEIKNFQLQAGRAYTIVLSGDRATAIETIMFDRTSGFGPMGGWPYAFAVGQCPQKVGDAWGAGCGEWPRWWRASEWWQGFMMSRHRTISVRGSGLRRS